MGLGALATRVGSGLLKASPYIARGAAGVAAAAGNPTLLNNMKEQDQQNYLRNWNQDERDYERTQQAHNRDLADAAATRQQQEFDTNQGLAGLQRQALQQGIDANDPEKKRQAALQQATDAANAQIEAGRQQAEVMEPYDERKTANELIAKGGTPIYGSDKGAFRVPTTPTPTPNTMSMGDVGTADITGKKSASVPNLSTAGYPQPNAPVLQRRLIGAKPPRDYAAEQNQRDAAAMARIQLEVTARLLGQANSANNSDKKLDEKAYQDAVNSAIKKAGEMNWMLMGDDPEGEAKKAAAIETEYRRLTGAASTPSASGGVPSLAPSTSSAIPPNPYKNQANAGVR